MRWGSRQLIANLESRARPPIVVASHHRSGTHLLIDSLRLNFRECQSWKYWGEARDMLYLALDPLLESQSGRRIARAHSVLSRSHQPLIKTHAFADLRSIPLQETEPRDGYLLTNWLNQNARFVYIYRDGRDAMRSLYEYVSAHDHSARVPFGEFIRQLDGGVNRVRSWADHVNGWLVRPKVYCLKMEEMLADPARALSHLGSWLGMKPSTHCMVPPINTRCAFSRLRARFLQTRPPSTAIHCVNPWSRERIVLSSADRQFFRREAGELLFKLGYDGPPRTMSCGENSVDLPLFVRPAS